MPVGNYPQRKVAGAFQPNVLKDALDKFYAKASPEKLASLAGADNKAGARAREQLAMLAGGTTGTTPAANRLQQLGAPQINYGRNQDWQEQEKYQDTKVNETEKTSQTEKVLEEIKGTTTATTTKGSAEINAQLERMLKVIIPGFMDKFSKESAIRDSDASMQAAISDVLGRGLPEVRSADTAAGGYNSTATKLLKDNVLAQAAAAGSRIRQETIANYADSSIRAGTVMSQMFQLAQEGTSKTATAEDRTGTTTGSADILSSVEKLLNDTTYARGTGVDKNADLLAKLEGQKFDLTSGNNDLERALKAANIANLLG